MAKLAGINLKHEHPPATIADGAQDGFFEVRPHPSGPTRAESFAS
jgi:hypothetical protein